MAVNSQINISINTTNAIKSIAELDNEIGGVVRTVTDLELTISSLSEELRATEIGTQRFKELQSALIEAQGHMKDFELSVEALDADQRASEFGSFAAGLAEIATGALALTHAMGLGSDETDKFVEKMVGGFAIANTFRGGLEGIISAQKLLKNSTLATTAATDGGTLSMKIFNAVSKANPIGILVTVLLTAVTAFALFSAAAGESVVELERAKKAVEDFDRAQTASDRRRSAQNKIQSIETQSQIDAVEDRYKREEITLKQFQEEKKRLITADIVLQQQIIKDEIESSKKRTEVLIKEKEEEAIGSDERAAAAQAVLDQINETLDLEQDLNVFRAEARAFEKVFNREMRDEREEVNKKTNELTEAQKKQIKTLEELKKAYQDLIALEDDYFLRSMNEEDQAIITRLRQLDEETAKVDASIMHSAEQREEFIKKLIKESEADITAIRKTFRTEREQKELTEQLAFEEKLNTIRLTALNNSLKDELDANKGNEEKQKKLTEDFNKLIIQSEIDKTKKLIAIRRAYGEDVEDLLLQLSQLELGLSTDVTEKTEETFEELFANVLRIAGAVIGQIQALSNAIGDSIKQQEENARQEREAGYAQEEASLQNMLNSGLLSREEYESQLTNLNTKREMEERAARRRSFEQQKKMNIANAIMSGAQAVLGGLATQPLVPLGLIMAALAAATTAIQISTIKSQTFSAAQGGIVPGTGPGNVDSVSALLAPGEAVINSNSTSMFGGLLSEINEMGGGKSLTPDLPMRSTTGGGKPVYQQNQKEQRVYVLENDITKSQRRVTRIEDIARF